MEKVRVKVGSVSGEGGMNLKAAEAEGNCLKGQGHGPSKAARSRETVMSLARGMRKQWVDTIL